MVPQSIMMRISSNKNNRQQAGINDVIFIRHLLNSLVLFIAVFPVYLLSVTSCANPGVGPSGGDKDSIPPVVVNSIPTQLQSQFTGKEMEILFNEYVVVDNISEKLVISPPLAKKPSVRTKGKSIIVKMEEDLIPDRTYSFDFGDGIKDYNEGNKMKSLRLVFSTGIQLDTLRISGFIYDAKSLMPAPNVLATLYSLDNDSVFKNLNPDFIARTDEKGYFLFDNLPEGCYKLYGLKDDDKNLKFSSANELIAFTDSMIIPTAHFVGKIDTVISGSDTSISKGHTEFLPENLTLLLFPDDFYSQYLISSKRESNEKCLFVFNEPVTDSLKFGVVGYDSIKNWKEIEYSQKLDSVSLWITDTTLAKKDTLLFSVKYPFTDTTGTTVMKTDTLKMLYSKPTQPTKLAKAKPSSGDNYFRFSNNLASNFDLNSNIKIEASSPVDSVGKGLFKLNEMINDSTPAPLTYELKAVNGSKRKFQLVFPLKENTKYQLSLDTAVIKAISGIQNAGFSTKFSTQKKDFYGSVILSISGVEGKGIIQLVKNDKQESLVREIPYDQTKKTIVLDYLKPEKYLLKFISDLNGNGKWDTGKLSEKRQPEPVCYFEKELAIKSNWEIKESWQINFGTIKSKPVTKEPDEKKNKK
jgi:hypothetical protein